MLLIYKKKVNLFADVMVTKGDAFRGGFFLIFLGPGVQAVSGIGGLADLIHNNTA